MPDSERYILPLDDQNTCSPQTPQSAAGAGAFPALPNIDFPPDPELVAQGWERRFMADAAKAKEATHLYSELGFDVHAEPVKPAELSEACGGCRLVACRAYVTIYTRRPSS